MDLKALKLTPRRQQLLESMHIFSVEDLLKCYPMRYEQIEIVPFEKWEKNDHVCFEGTVVSSPSLVRLMAKRTMTRFKVLSQNQELDLTVFNRPWLKSFTPGAVLTLFGIYQGNNRVTITSFNNTPLEKQLGLKPIYSLGKDLRQSDMKAAVQAALTQASSLPQLVPERYLEKYRLLPAAQAYEWIHQPPDEKALHAAIRTLKYEEFLCFQCVMQAAQTGPEARAPRQIDSALIEKKIQQLPFELTPDQKKALDDILQDLRSSHLMYRMVQGDVGCGKTAVAMLALYAAASAGVQTAFLAPTEILARQHAQNLEKMNIPASLYVSALPVRQKREVLKGLKDGSISCVVGTHALFQEKVEFQRLGFVIADEQQRFGVLQRRSLLEKGEGIDFLMMSATPIPRTYAHFLYGDIALSEIHTLPAGRSPVATRYIPGTSMKPILKHILKAVRQEHRQVYVVAAMIEENPEMNLKAAQSLYEGMQEVIGHLVRLDLLHGRMKAEEKQETMDRFKNHETDLLISTTVVEVGVDVPNATLMVIYDADRFGLSTLHQLRGRVARGSTPGECYLLSASRDPLAIERLRKMEELLDGFAISAYDLAKRGPGDILGTRQSGLPSFILGDFEKDPAIMEVACADAREILTAQCDEAILAYTAAAVENARYFD